MLHMQALFPTRQTFGLPQFARCCQLYSAQLTSVAKVIYPDLYQRLLNALDALNLDLSWVLAAGCVGDFDVHGGLLISTIGPIVAMSLLAIMYTVAVSRHRGSEEALPNVQHKHLPMVLLVTFLAYSSVGSVLFQMFDWEDLDNGKYYLRADYST